MSPTRAGRHLSPDAAPFVLRGLLGCIDCCADSVECRCWKCWPAVGGLRHRLGYRDTRPRAEHVAACRAGVACGACLGAAWVSFSRPGCCGQWSVPSSRASLARLTSLMGGAVSTNPWMASSIAGSVR